jgi:hypothetical protein
MIRPPRVPRALFDWLTLTRSAAIVAIVGGGFVWFAWSAYRHGGTEGLGSVLGWAPLVGFVLAAPLIGLFVGYAGWVDERTWKPWHGIYRAFDDHQIRVTEARDALWFSSDDVHAALGLSSRPAALKSLRVTEYRRDDELGDVLSNAGLAAVFGRSTDRRTLRLVAWADRDVRKPWQNRRDGVEIAARPTDAPAAAAASSPVTVIPSRSRPIDR